MKTYKFNGLAMLIIILGLLGKKFITEFPFTCFEIVIIALLCQGITMMAYLIEKLDS